MNNPMQNYHIPSLVKSAMSGGSGPKFSHIKSKDWETKHVRGKQGTLFETENERQKTKPVPIPLPWASRNFPDVKKSNGFFFYNWTLEIIRFGKQMDKT